MIRRIKEIGKMTALALAETGGGGRRIAFQRKPNPQKAMR